MNRLKRRFSRRTPEQKLHNWEQQMQLTVEETEDGGQVQAIFVCANLEHENLSRNDTSHMISTMSNSLLMNRIYPPPPPVKQERENGPECSDAALVEKVKVEIDEKMLERVLLACGDTRVGYFLWWLQPQSHDLRMLWRNLGVNPVGHLLPENEEAVVGPACITRSDLKSMTTEDSGAISHLIGFQDIVLSNAENERKEQRSSHCNIL